MSAAIADVDDSESNESNITTTFGNSEIIVIVNLERSTIHPNSS